MRDFNLRFFRDRWPDDIFDLNEVDSLNMLKGIGGNYVIGSLDGTQFVYQRGCFHVCSPFVFSFQKEADDNSGRLFHGFG